MSVRPVFNGSRGTTGPRQSSMVYRLGKVGLPLAGPFIDSLSCGCKQDKY